MKNELEIALVKELCPICCREIDGPIIMNSILTVSEAEKVKELQEKIIGFSENACEECAKHKDEIVYLIGIDPTQSNLNKLEELYRTGDILGIKKESNFIANIDPKFILKTKNEVNFIFVDKDVINSFK